MFLLVISGLLINRPSNTGLMAIGVFGVLVGFGILLMIWEINRAQEERAGPLTLP